MKPTHTPSSDWGQLFRITETGTCRLLTTGMVLPAAQTDVAVPFPQDGSGKPRNLRGRHKIYMRVHENEDDPTLTVYVGGAGVTTADGYVLPAQEILILDVTDRVQLYVTKATTGIDIHFRTMEVA